MREAKQQKEWVREEVVVLVTEYFRTKDKSVEEITKAQEDLSSFLRKREELLTGQKPPEIFRNYAGIRMQSGRIRCIDPDTPYSGMKGTKLQKEIVREYLQNPETINAEAMMIYNKYNQ